MGKTLEELEGTVWEETGRSTPLVASVLRLRKKPLDELTIADLCTLLGQALSAEHLMPLALDVLERDPLAEGDFYPGDLFVSVTRQRKTFWSEHPEFEERATVVAERLARKLRETWDERKQEARRLYGASLDDRSAGCHVERHVLELAEGFASSRGRFTEG